MAGKSSLAASEEQKAGLKQLAAAAGRAEADRARAILLTLDGWTSPRIAEAFGVREDTVRFWWMTFASEGLERDPEKLAPVFRKDHAQTIR